MQHWRDRFRRAPLAENAVAALRQRSDEIWHHAFELLKRESPEYRNSVDDEFTKESKAHCNELLRLIVAIASARLRKFSADPFDFVRTHAAWRARHQVPLIASLHAYRLAHRTYSEITRDAVLRHGSTEAIIHSLTVLSDFWMQFFDFVGAVLAEAHVNIAGLPQAIDEARVAVEFANAVRPLMHFSDIDLQEFVIRRSDSAAARLVPPWIRQINLADDDQWRELMRTIRAFADCSLNVKQTARRLGVHTNTVYFRLNRVRKLSGVNPRTYSGISMLLTAFRLLEVHGGSGP